MTVEREAAAMYARGVPASVIGRTLAPDHIKDREGWGRKLVRKVAAIFPRTQAQVHAEALTRCNVGRDYKAPHAYRGGR